MTTADNQDLSPDPLRWDDFPPADANAWRAEVERLLQGAPFDSLVTTLPQGLRIAPLYAAADLADGIWGASRPGQAPFLRGARPAGEGTPAWLVAQELPLADAGAFNPALLHGLARGQSAVNLRLDAAGRCGLDPADAPAALVGADGTSIADLADLRRALADVDLAALPVIVQAGAAALPLAALLAALLAERGQSPAILRGTVGGDPVATLASLGAATAPVDSLFDQLAVLTTWAGAAAPSLRTLTITDETWHEAGADGVLSLGLSLAAGIQTLREMEARGLSPADCAPRFAFHLSLDSDFFLEIARLRALRVLWSDVLVASGCPAPASSVWIHARTGRRMFARLDPHTNLLRATTAAMSAVCGGVDSLHVTPWDALNEAPGEAGRRLARNLHLILAHECRFGDVDDPTGGSWYVESLTRRVGEGAWAVMQGVERAGGLRAALDARVVQRMIADAAADRAERLRTAREVRVGVNRFGAGDAAPRPAPGPDAAWLAGRRAAGAGRSPSVAPIDARAPAGARFAALLTAAADGATLGALAAGLRAGAAAGTSWEPVIARREAEPFEAPAPRFDAPGGGA